MFAHFVPSQARPSLNCHCHEVCALWLLTLSCGLSLGDCPRLSPCYLQTDSVVGTETLGFESENLALDANFAMYLLCAFGQHFTSLVFSLLIQK